MSAPENPQAFPLFWPDASPSEGMSLRDYFAGQCNIAVYNPRDSFIQARGASPTVDELAAYIAQIRFIEADAMLLARAAISRAQGGE